MLKKALLLSSSVLIAAAASAQTTFLQLGSDGYHYIDRWETLSGRLCDSLANGDKPESRRNIVRFIESLNNGPVPAVNDSGSNVIEINASKKLGRKINYIDHYNMQQMVSESGEWAGDENGAIDSRRSLFNTF